MEIKFDNKGIEIEVKSRIKLISQINFFKKGNNVFHWYNEKKLIKYKETKQKYPVKLILKCTFFLLHL